MLQEHAQQQNASKPYAALSAPAREKTFIVIDGNSLMHRAFHAVPFYMTAPDGRSTNACFGFMSMLLKLIEEYHPDAVICAFDQGVPEFRLKALESYKAQRPPTDPLLKEQFPMIQELLTSMNIPIVQMQDWEGDDIIGTLGRRGEEAGYRMYLVTGDRDAFQLASTGVSIIATRVGVSDVMVYGPDEVCERYGVGPELVPDYIALKGDPSDNIPGLPGVGEKTATKLLQLYGSLEGIIAHKDELKPKMQESLNEHENELFNGRIVATISRDVPIELDLTDLCFPCFEEAPVRAAFGTLGIRAQLPKILKLISGEDTEIGRFEERVSLPARVAKDAQEAFLEEIRSAARRGETQPVALVIDSDGEVTLFDDNHRLIVATPDGCAEFVGDRIAEVVATLLHEVSVVTFDAKILLREVVPLDSSLPALIDPLTLDCTRIFDVSLAAYLLESTRASYTIQHLAERYLKRDLPSPDDTVSAAHIEAAALLALHGSLEEALTEDGSLDCYRDIDMPLIPVLVNMERTGVFLDVPRVHALASHMHDQLEDLTRQIHELAGTEFNIASPKQLATILFEKLMLPTQKKTQRGYSTDASVLEDLSLLHPLPRLVLEYRELSKLKSTYLDTLPTMLADDHRLHTTFNQTITATGRLSSSDPNLQNIPVRSALGREIRTAFVAGSPTAHGEKVDGEEWRFVSADYSQIELRLLADLSGDEGLITAFTEGRDFHAATASRIFNIPIDELPPEIRNRAKAVNFGIVYGQQAFGLSSSLSISFKEAQDMIDRYFKAYPQVRRYLDHLIDEAQTTGYAVTMFGRKRRVPELHASKPAQREAGKRVAMNHPLQGTAADIIKLAMIEVQRRLRDEGFRAEFMLQVHDELDFNCPVSELDRLEKMVTTVMENVVTLKVPLAVSCSSGENWAEAH